MSFNINTLVSQTTLKSMENIIIKSNNDDLKLGDFMEKLPENITKDIDVDINIKFINITKLSKVLFAKRANFHRKAVIRILLEGDSHLYIKKRGNMGYSYFHPVLLPLFLGDYEDVNTMIKLNKLALDTFINNSIELYDMRAVDNNE